jgi:hypothetical protein
MDFSATVKTEPPGVLKGSFKCAVTPHGIQFRQGKTLDFLIPVGTPAEHRPQNRVLVSLPEYRIDMTVVKWGSFADRFARDVALFVSGRGAPPQEHEYKMPVYLWVLALLPIGMPVITRGGAIPGAIAGAMVMVTYGIVQREDWPLAARIAGALAVSAGLYSTALALVAASQSVPR